MKLSYYPGCTLKNHAGNFEASILYSMRHLGIEVEELHRWNCCGTVLSLSQDDLMHQLAPIRNLIRAREAQSARVMTACSMCYNTLKRANERFRADPVAGARMNAIMYDEAIPYRGDVEVIHILEALREARDDFASVSARVVRPLNGLRVACYYGCLLVRPRSIAFDRVEDPVLLDRLMAGLGGQAVAFSHKTECCGAYQTVDRPEIIADRTRQIVTAAREQGAELIAVSCPLCAYNLDHRQTETRRLQPDFQGLPVVYFTQLMAIAFGSPEAVLRLDLHHMSPRPVLAAKGLL